MLNLSRKIDKKRSFPWIHEWNLCRFLLPFFCFYFSPNNDFWNEFSILFILSSFDKMLLILRLQLFASALASVAYGAVGDASEEFYRVVIHEPFYEHDYLYHFEYCFIDSPQYTDDCWVTTIPFPTHKKVKDYYIT